MTKPRSPAGKLIAMASRIIEERPPEQDNNLKAIGIATLALITALGSDDQSEVDEGEAGRVAQWIGQASSQHFPDLCARLPLIRRSPLKLTKAKKHRLRDELAAISIASTAKQLESIDSGAATRMKTASEMLDLGHTSLAMFLAYRVGQDVASNQLVPVLEKKHRVQTQAASTARDAKKSKAQEFHQERARQFAVHFLEQQKVFAAAIKAGAKAMNVNPHTLRSWAGSTRNHKIWMREVRQLESKTS
jgi:hypothetical protein